MLEYLVKLADYLDRKGLRSKANLVDSFIVEAQSTDFTSHPLAPKVLDYVENAFMVSDEGSSDGIIAVRKINELVDAGLRTNADTLESYNSIDENPNPIQLRQFQELFLSAIKLIKPRYKFKGNPDYNSVAELIDIVYKNYEESYMEEYMGQASKPGDFPPSGQVGVASPIPVKTPVSDNLPTEEYASTI